MEERPLARKNLPGVFISWFIQLPPCLRIRRMSDSEPKLPLWQGIIVFVVATVGLPLLMLLLLWIATRFS